MVPIRTPSSARFSARGELGGLSRAARAAIDCLDAAGFDLVIVETVGAGQSETRHRRARRHRGSSSARPGSATTCRRLKAGILEIADLLVVSKGDLPLAEQTAREMREMLGLRRSPAADAWTPRVVVVRALVEGGVDGLLEAIEVHALSVAAGRRLRDAAVAPLGPVPDPATISSEDAAGWRARLQALAARDGLCSALGITVLAGGPGRSEVAMTVAARHLNFNGGCHGGAIFSLADSAFGLASNSHGPLASGIAAHITYQAGVREGERLVARATEVSRSRRVAVYRIDVVRPEPGGDETAVSSFTGTVSIKA